VSDLCGYKGCVRLKDHGTPGNPDTKRSHKYNEYGMKRTSVPSVPSEPPEGAKLMRSLQMHRKGITYKPGRKVSISGSAREWHFSEEIWDIDHPGWEWVEVKDAHGRARIFPLHRLDQQ
jgi:hypothetical protein